MFRIFIFPAILYMRNVRPTIKRKHLRETVVRTTAHDKSIKELQMNIQSNTLLNQKEYLMQYHPLIQMKVLQIQKWAHSTPFLPS